MENGFLIKEKLQNIAFIEHLAVLVMDKEKFEALWSHMV